MNFEDIVNQNIFGKESKMAEISSFQPAEPINPFKKSKTTEEALKDECNYHKERFDIDNNNCEICEKKINDGGYVLQRTEDNKNFYFCSSECINIFKSKGHPVNTFQLYKVSRCASYRCCLELGNLRRLCEKTESLTDINLLDNLNRINFCEPAVAGQIQASYAIYKHLQRVDEENEKLSIENTNLNKRTQCLTIISTIMAVLTIILTGISVVKNFKDKPIEYKDELESIQKTLQREMEDIEIIRKNNEKIETSVEKIIINTKNVENEEDSESLSSKE